MNRQDGAARHRHAQPVRPRATPTCSPDDVERDRPGCAALIAARATTTSSSVYVNDNHEDFAATRHDIVERALDGRHPELVEPIVPPDGGAFLQKARHSAFYSTALDHLLRERDVETDRARRPGDRAVHPLQRARRVRARLRRSGSPRDAVAHIDAELGDAALRMMERNMRVDVLRARESEGVLRA